MRLRKILLNNIWLKIISLFLAFLTWFYITETEKTGSESTILQKFLASAYISKSLKIEPSFTGEVPKGYEFLKNDVKIIPESIIIVGPARILSKKESIKTQPIDLSEHTKSKTLDVNLENISTAIKSSKTRVEVYLPVEKVETKRTGK